MNRFAPLALGSLMVGALALSACQPDGPVHSAPQPDASVPPPHADPDKPVLQAYPLAAELVRLEWSNAENRAACAPVTFTDAGGIAFNARRAEFSGGWAVAFDLPGTRSAFGIAGTGLLPDDRDDPAAQERRLKAQWPHFRRLPDLPQPAFAGYGLEGARAYPADAPDGVGSQSLAYLRIGGQQCLYNVWSKLGRAHLETLLDSLRML
ncbi:hypothetical protein MB02_10945 [Croceicoccus estronivorus]|uniref:hypothetical protein n=1 Tax=Croceicoccus estronivorus TaxID=1172626 RepID=UPI000830CD7F|nr:hypothetical protein [Croceicoccus estronivorus]OCC23671.1 hypothetical protein MB02_10945 [Croceicoccus estronivorus]